MVGKKVLVLVLLAVFLVGCGAFNPVVPNDQVGYVLNPTWSPDVEDMLPADRYAEKYEAVYTAGETYPRNDPVKLEPFAVVPPGTVAFNIVTRQIMIPGPYPRVPASDMTTPVSAVFVGIDWAAIRYDAEAERFRQLPPKVGQYDLPVDQVRFYPTGVQRYRLLRADLLGNADACASFLCETSLTRAMLSGTALDMTVDMDVLFEFVITEDTLASLWGFGDPKEIVQSYIGTTLRSARADSGVLTMDAVETPEGRAQLASIYLDRLQEAVQRDDVPLVVSSVNIRSVTVGDTEFQAQQNELERSLEAERERANVIALQEANLLAEQDLEAKRRAFDREQALLDAQNRAQVNQVILTSVSGAPWQVLWVLEVGGDIQPYLNADGTLSQPPVLLPTVVP